MFGDCVSSSSKVIVREVDTSRVVYVTNWGQHYHYSKSCAGEGAGETTQERAKKQLLTPCSKCVK